MADPVWERKFRGENVSVALEDITVQRMREIKTFFGDDYGIPSRFISLLLMGEMDALAAALWIHGEVTGKPIGNPLQFDFNLSEFAEPDKPKRTVKRKPEPDPTQAGTSDGTA